MPKELTWDDAEDLGILLSEKHSELDPLNVRFTDLHRYVTELPEFKDDPKSPTRASWKQSRWPGTRNSWIAPKAKQLNSFPKQRLTFLIYPYLLVRRRK